MENGDQKQAADTLYSIDTDYVEGIASDSYRQLYNVLMNRVAPDVSTALYESGKTSINQNDFTSAITSLNEAWFFASVLPEPDPEMLYELAVAYQMAGDADKARESYQKVISTFPESSTATKASERLNEMEQNGDVAAQADNAGTQGGNAQADNAAEDTQQQTQETAQDQGADDNVGDEPEPDGAETVDVMQPEQ